MPMLSSYVTSTSTSTSTTTTKTTITITRLYCFVILSSISHNLANSVEMPANSEQPFASISTSALLDTNVSLACDLQAPSADDFVSLVLWYKDDSKAPIFTIDARNSRSLDKAKITVDETFAAQLIIYRLKQSDAGDFRCRVDFAKGRTTNTIITLKVVEAPRELLVYHNDAIINSSASSLATNELIGPLEEGGELRVTCDALGGSPRPSLVWTRDSQLIDDTYEHFDANGARNELVIESLNRSHLMSTFTCHASNSNLTKPLQRSFKLDMSLKPQDVLIRWATRGALVVGQLATFDCISRGSRPPASIYWLFRDSRFDKPQSYPPQVQVKAANNKPHEGQDVYLSCELDANPTPLKPIAWRFNNKPLNAIATSTTNTNTNIVVANESLVLRNVNKNQTGTYQCEAQNAVGANISEPFDLQVRYAPTCTSLDVLVYEAFIGQTLDVECHVSANPQPLPESAAFAWFSSQKPSTTNYDQHDLDYHDQLEATEINANDVQLDSIRRVLKFKVKSADDLSTRLKCRAKNIVGLQQAPCSFRFRLARPHGDDLDDNDDKLRNNCSVTATTATSLKIVCLESQSDSLKERHYNNVINDYNDNNNNDQDHDTQTLSWQNLDDIRYNNSTQDANANSLSTVPINKPTMQQQHQRPRPRLQRYRKSQIVRPAGSWLFGELREMPTTTTTTLDTSTDLEGRLVAFVIASDSLAKVSNLVDELRAASQQQFKHIATTSVKYARLIRATPQIGHHKGTFEFFVGDLAPSRRYKLLMFATNSLVPSKRPKQTLVAETTAAQDIGSDLATAAASESQARMPLPPQKSLVTRSDATAASSGSTFDQQQQPNSAHRSTPTLVTASTAPSDQTNYNNRDSLDTNADSMLAPSDKILHEQIFAVWHTLASWLAERLKALKTIGRREQLVGSIVGVSVLAVCLVALTCRQKPKKLGNKNAEGDVVDDDDEDDDDNSEGCEQQEPERQYHHCNQQQQMEPNGDNTRANSPNYGIGGGFVNDCRGELQTELETEAEVAEKTLVASLYGDVRQGNLLRAPPEMIHVTTHSAAGNYGVVGCGEVGSHWNFLNPQMAGISGAEFAVTSDGDNCSTLPYLVDTNNFYNNQTYLWIPSSEKLDPSVSSTYTTISRPKSYLNYHHASSE